MRRRRRRKRTERGRTGEEEEPVGACGRFATPRLGR